LIRDISFNLLPPMRYSLSAISDQSLDILFIPVRLDHQRQEQPSGSGFEGYNTYGWSLNGHVVDNKLTLKKFGHTIGNMTIFHIENKSEGFANL
jgi:hypothetical protein